MAATGIKKLKRSHLMHLLDSTFGGETPSWFLIGKNIEDMSMDLGPDTATVKNILDETDVNDNGYEPSLSVETYYANTEDAIYEKIKSIALDRLVGDDCKSKYLEVLTMHGWKIASLSRSHMADRRAVSTYRLISNPAAIVLRVL